MNKICHENMSLAETVLDWVREMISRVRGATMEAELRHIERLYRKGIAEAKKNAAQEGGTEYISEKWKQKIHPGINAHPQKAGANRQMPHLWWILSTVYHRKMCLSRIPQPVFPFLKKTKALLTS